MGYSVKVVNTETGLGWSSFGAPAKPFLRPDTNAAYRVRQLQYAYFLETRWVRPIPLRTARIAIESKQADRADECGKRHAGLRERLS